jgi:hypothetical protein
VKNAHNQDVIVFHQEKDHMTSLLDSAQSRQNSRAGAADQWMIGNALTTSLRLCKIPCGLHLAPLAERASCDAKHILHSLP